MPNRTVEELKNENGNKTYRDLANYLKNFQANSTRGTRGTVNQNDIEPYVKALNYLGGETNTKTEEGVRENLNTLKNGFFDFLTNKAKDSEYTNFQILYAHSYDESKNDSFYIALGRVNEELGLGIEFDHPSMHWNQDLIYPNINEINDEPEDKKEENKKEENKKINPLGMSYSYSDFNPELNEQFNYGHVNGFGDFFLKDDEESMDEDSEYNYDRYTDINEDSYRPLGNEEKNAYDWIEDFKLDNTEPGQDQRLLAARIFAARILVNSEPGNGNSLKHPVNGKDIDRVAKELLNNKHFNDFVMEKERGELANVINKYGHGGKLENRFKNYLLTRPAGELQNDRILDRFMPTAWDRINELKKQAKKVRDGSINKEIAETMVLRRMVGAERNTPDRLKVKIPTVGKLTEQVSYVAYGAEEAGNDVRVKTDFREGHGGLMIENMKNAKEVHKKMLRDAMDIGTVENKFKSMQDKAGAIVKKLEAEPDQNSDEYKALTRDAKEIIAQVVAIYDRIVQKGNVISEETLRTTMPQNDVELQSSMEGLINNTVFNNKLFPNNAPESFITHLKGFIENPLNYARETRNTLQPKNPENQVTVGNIDESPVIIQKPEFNGPKF